MAELADALDSGSSGHYVRAGSSPVIRIQKKDHRRNDGLFLVNPIKTPGYAGGISELQLQAKTSYAIIILSPPRHKKA